MDSQSLAQFIDLLQSPTYFMYFFIPFWFIYMPFFLVLPRFEERYKIWYAVSIQLMVIQPLKTIIINISRRNMFCCNKNKESKSVKRTQKCLAAISQVDSIINFFISCVLSWQGAVGVDLIRRQKIENYFIPDYYSTSKFSIEVFFSKLVFKTIGTLV